jgi:hypothetical protein
MKISHTLTALVVSGLLLLAHSNPRDRGPYVAFLSEQATSLMCNGTPGELCEDLCTMLQPVASQVTRGILTLYTEPPSDYLVFTVFPYKSSRPTDLWNWHRQYVFTGPVDTGSLQLCELLSQLSDQREAESLEVAQHSSILGDLYVNEFKS